jgi:hypothetical protein
MADQQEGRSLSEVRRKYEGELISRAGVVGVSEGKRGAEDVIQVLVTQKRDDLDIPRELEGYPVEVVEVGEITTQD